MTDPLDTRARELVLSFIADPADHEAPLVDLITAAIRRFAEEVAREAYDEGSLYGARIVECRFTPGPCTCGGHISETAASPEPERTGGAGERTYPCLYCLTMRTKAEGGTVFSVCDECWDKHPPGTKPSAPPAPVTYRAGTVPDKENE
jgi:hypothetical protein